jgi:hypothetical protein
MSQLIATDNPTMLPVSHAEERRAYATFAQHYSDEGYRHRLAELYQTWAGFNATFFRGRLVEPHLTFGLTAPRNLGYCHRTTDYGGKVQVGLNHGLVFGSNLDWVVHPWPPAVGTRRFLDDLLLRFTVRQFVLEELNADETGYRGFGPKFVREANRIGRRLDLPPVAERVGRDDERQPQARGWPHCVRPADYYGGDVTEAALRLAGGCPGTRQAGAAARKAGVLMYLHYLLGDKRADRAEEVLARHFDWERERGEERWPAPRKIEAGEFDVDSRTPLGAVEFDPAWLRWQGGMVRVLAEDIRASASFVDLPLLADVLREAGCTDGRILRHLGAKMEHKRSCWVLRGLLVPTEKAGTE